MTYLAEGVLKIKGSSRQDVPNRATSKEGALCVLALTLNIVTAFPHPLPPPPATVPLLLSPAAGCS